MTMPLRVLFVEDSEDDMLFSLRELRRAGYNPTYRQVDTAAAMSQALADQPWDVVIADQSMPEFSGLAALALLRQRGIDLPFILVSGTIGEETAVAAMKAGAHDYIMKDNLARLVPAVERELRDAEVRRNRKRAEALSLRLSTILDNAPSEIYVFSTTSLGFLQSNQTARQHLGYSAQELESLTPLALFPEFSEEQLAAVLQPLRAGERAQVDFETVCRRKNGDMYPVSVSVHRSSADVPPVFAALVQDLTGSKRLEHRLVDIEDRERHRMASALHDTVLPPLLAAFEAMQVSQMRSQEAALKAELQQEIGLVQRAVQELRNAIYHLQLDTV